MSLPPLAFRKGGQVGGGKIDWGWALYEGTGLAGWVREKRKKVTSADGFEKKSVSRGRRDDVCTCTYMATAHTHCYSTTRADVLTRF